jgi:hypothetical protein
MKNLLAVAFISLVACTGTVSPVNNATYSKNPSDFISRAGMTFTLDTVNYSGVATVDLKAKHTFVFNMPDDTIKVMITTCSREEFFIEPGDRHDRFVYNYMPVPYVETTDSCFLTATAINNKGMTGKAIIDFKTTESLPAKMACNGAVISLVGAYLCQSREGLIQMLTFTSPTVWVAQLGCPNPVLSAVPFSYELKIGKKFCAYQFMDKDKRVFRLTTFGYTAINEVILDGG